MRQLAGWASAHKWSARLLIVLIYQFLNTAGYFNGFFLSAAGTPVPLWVFQAALCIGGAAILLYPAARRTPDRNRRFLRTRGIHLVLGCCSCCIFLQLGNYEGAGLTPVPPVQPAAAAVAHPVRWGEKAIRYLSQQKVRLHPRRLVTRIRQWYRDLSDGAKAGLVALTIVVGLAAILLLAALACDLACSGAEVLAVILLVAGIAGVIVGVIFLCRYIMHGPRPRPERP